MTPPASITIWLTLLRAGDEAPARVLWLRYQGIRVELALCPLAGHVHHSADAGDNALAAFVTFCAGAMAARFANLSDRHTLWRVLLV